MAQSELKFVAVCVFLMYGLHCAVAQCQCPAGTTLVTVRFVCLSDTPGDDSPQCTPVVGETSGINIFAFPAGEDAFGCEEGQFSTANPPVIPLAVGQTQCTAFSLSCVVSEAPTPAPAPAPAGSDSSASR